MKHEIDLKGYKVRTDLLSEILDRELKDYKREIKYFDDIKVETIELDKKSAEVINKKEGIYKTIYFEDVTDEDNYKILGSYIPNQTVFEYDNQTYLISDNTYIVNDELLEETVNPLGIDLSKLNIQNIYNLIKGGI